MVESYRIKSKFYTAVSFLAAFIVYVGKDGLAEVIPSSIAYIIPVIVFIAGYIVTQSTENTRVEVAEQLAVEDYLKESNEKDYDKILNHEYNSAYGDDEI